MRKKFVYLIGFSVLIYSSYVLIDYFTSYFKEEKEHEQLQKIVQQNSYKYIYENYENVIGWININGLRLDNPLMQAKNNEFYLTHNYKGEKARTGSIFVDYRNNPEFTDRHTIIYGHVLRNGSMFGQLAAYANQDFALQHEEITINLKNETLRLQVFAAYETTTDFYYIETNFTEKSFTQFLNTIQEKSEISMKNVAEEDQIVTLSTCTTSTDDKERFVVHAKIVERIEN